MADKKCVCDHCRYRHSWDCDDGLSYPKGGCDSFELDFETLSRKQKKAIQKILSHNDYDRPHNSYWED